ncbi:MAG TPA: polysaccharide deacetylase family protein [Myxococcota bacterium]|nr:polysaccharide deacetylase family protein [Myxococcota bacterium]
MTPRAVACFTFDNLGEAAEIGAGRPRRREAPRHPSLEIGLPRILELLDRAGVRGAFFVEGWNGTHEADALREIVRRGHELGMHGWLHEEWRSLDVATERSLAARATEAIERGAGVRPRGFRAPGGGRTPATPEILRALGYRYDASLGDGMRPAPLAPDLAQIPFVWPGVDGAYYLADRPAAPEVVRTRWLEALDRTAERGGLFVTVCHPFVTGVELARCDALAAVIEAALADPRVEVVTPALLAERVLAETPELRHAGAVTPPGSDG